MDDQEKVRAFRTQVQSTWPTPTTVDSLRFTAQELFELDSVLMRLGYQGRVHSRNTKDPQDLQEAMLLELGQTYLMLITLANNLGVSLSGALDKALEHQGDKLK